MNRAYLHTLDRSKRMTLPRIPALPNDPGEQGDPLHTEAPAESERGGRGGFFMDGGSYESANVKGAM
jgi:hypothetical protein